MIKKPLQRFVFVFWLLTFCNLLATAFNTHWLYGLTKSLLMPSLTLLLIYANVETSGKKLVIAALFFSWLGDLFLLFESRNPLFFIIGLLSFLITHICYIIYFLSNKKPAQSLLKKRPIYILLIIIYGAGLVLLVFPYLNQLKIPVIIYATVICGMLLSSIHIYLKTNHPANRYFVAGALLFILSDSILAINKFYVSIPLAGIWIMLSYCAAQYFIVSGFIEVNEYGGK